MRRLWALLLILSAPLTWAQEGELFVLDLNDGWIIGTGLGVNLAAGAVEAANPFPGTVWDNPIDGSGWAPSESADWASKALTLAALATPSVMLTTDSRQWWGVGTVYAESLVWAWGLKDLGKAAFHRVRPGDGTSDSFPSGHSTLAFTGAAFATVAFGRAHPGSPWTLPLGVATYGLAATAAALRVTSGNHYLTDVVAGAVVGTLAGVVVPWLHRGQGPRLGVGEGGVSLGFALP